mgnify:CR=1 FL=1
METEYDFEEQPQDYDPENDLNSIYDESPQPADMKQKENIARCLECLEIVKALETLEYHNRNYLSNSMSNTNQCSIEKRKLLSEAINILEGIKE